MDVLEKREEQVSASGLRREGGGGREGEGGEAQIMRCLRNGESLRQ